MSASLTVYVNNISDGSATISFHKMLTDWNESSTWNSLSSGVSIDDVEATSSADAVVASPGTSGFITITGLASTVQEWLDGASTNFGWAVVSDDDNGWDFDSSEHSTASHRPELNITYSTAVDDAPTADAGPDQSIAENAVVTLDATGSTDPESQPLTYTWVQTGGPAVVLSDANAAQPTFTAPELLVNTDLTFQLTANDGTSDSVDTVTISVDAENPQQITFYLDGVGDGSDLPIASLKTPAPTDTSLDNFDPGRDSEAGLYLSKGGADVNESDSTKQQTWISSVGGQDLDGPASLTIWSAIKNFDTSKAGNITAYLVDSNAGGTSVTEIASANLSRADWDIANSGSWIEDTLDFGNVNYTLANDRYVGVKIIVDGNSDDHMWFAYDEVSLDSKLEVTLADQAPTASAGPDQGVDEGTVVTLDATASSDPESQTMTYTWAQTSGPSVTLSDANAEQPTFTAPELLVNTDITFQLTANDGTNDSVDTVVITVNADNDNPTAVADSATADFNTPVVVDLTANDTDPENNTITVLDVGNPSHGTVVDNEDGTVTYTPDTDYVGPDSFSYVVDDGNDTAAYWRLDGDAIDSGGTNDGVVTGTTTVEGEYGSALSFDEVDDHVVVSDFGFTNDFSVSFSIKIDDNSGSLFQYIYSHGDINTTNSLNVFLNESSHGTDPNQLRTVIRDADDSLDNTALEFDASSIIGDGQWHTYTLTVASGEGAKVYLDGALQNADATRGGDAFDPVTDLHLGGRHDLNLDRMYGGSLDSVQVFDRALSADDISDTHSGGISLATVDITVNGNQAPRRTPVRTN